MALRSPEDGLTGFSKLVTLPIVQHGAIGVALPRQLGNRAKSVVYVGIEFRLPTYGLLKSFFDHDLLAETLGPCRALRACGGALQARFRAGLDQHAQVRFTNDLFFHVSHERQSRVCRTRFSGVTPTKAADDREQSQGDEAGSIVVGRRDVLRIRARDWPDQAIVGELQPVGAEPGFKAQEVAVLQTL